MPIASTGGYPTIRNPLCRSRLLLSPVHIQPGILPLSSMTYPHQLVRLILIEQIYRADCITRGIPCHK
ncbi:hypothetical protein ASZ90_014614 [hydrocarbon metagenome]|uniref:Uncharacterized protein n=1 Tax=hydrocarbon metagenome TaxID=938273 RepID=A0A0W8F4L4_9ZZZZ